jgi:hypothetical protein
VRETFAGDTAGLDARISRKGKASHRGGIWVSAGNFCRGRRRPGCENHAQGKGSVISLLHLAAARMPRTETQGAAGVREFSPARKPNCPPNSFQSPPQTPLRDLCAMLSPLRVVPPGSRRCPPNSSPPRIFFLTAAWEEVPQSLVHSQSTILGGHKASLVSHRGLNVLKRIGGTGQETGIIKR